MDVAQILGIGRRWWWLLLLGVLFSVAAYGVSVRLRRDQVQPSYAASATLFVALPPPPESALAADAALRPWELDRLMATYAEMAKSRTVAERAVRDGALLTTPDDLGSRTRTETFGYTQLLHISVSAAAPDAADRSVAAIVRAFADVRTERSIPGDASLYETSAAVRTDRPTPLVVNLAIVALAGFMASGGVIFAVERLRPALALAAGEQPGSDARGPVMHERAV